jgi:hypothetical protein
VFAHLKPEPHRQFRPNDNTSTRRSSQVNAVLKRIENRLDLAASQIAILSRLSSGYQFRISLSCHLVCLLIGFSWRARRTV